METLIANRTTNMRTRSPFLRDPAIMTASAINKELDGLERWRADIGDAMIKAGRGHETLAQTLERRREYDPDLLTIAWCDCFDRVRQLRDEIDRRMGPNAPSRFPKDQLRSFKPMR